MENQPPHNPYANNPYANQPFQQGMFGMQTDLPNTTIVLVLGICSIIICALGPILATISLVISTKTKRLYTANPNGYTISSYKQLVTGRTCAIVGLSIGILFWLAFIAYVIWVYMMIQMANQQMEEALQHMQ